MRVIFAIQRLIYPIINLNFIGFFKYYKPESKVVVISSLLTTKKFLSESICWEIGFINALIERKINFSIKSLSGNFQNKIIFWSPNQNFDKYKVRNYTDSITFLAKQLEKQGNKIFVKANEIKYLENKYYMHKKFDELEINTPTTWYYKSVYDIDYNLLTFPLLFKGVHSSGSQDIFKLNNLKDLKIFISDFERHNPNLEIVLQKLVNMRKDMRVTTIGNEIIFSFWRINKSKEWQTTATKNGASVIFEDVPDQWKNYILECVKKTKMDICGLDITFENDNIKNKPYILEVSPRFSQNPPYKNKKFTYGDYKKKVFIKNNYRYNQTKVLIDLAKKYIFHLLDKKNILS